MRIRAVGVDAAFANMGFARVTIDVHPAGSVTVQCDGLALVSTEPEGKKVVRRSSDRLRRAREIRAALIAACEGATFAFVEVPSGTQNAAAAFGLGIAVGVLASCPVPIIEVSPMEVKEAVAGRRVKKGATKAEVIAWAADRWPGAPWIRAKTRTKTLPAGRLTADNEHLADAMAAVVAGVATPEFQRLVTLGLAADVLIDTIATPRLEHAAASNHHIGPTPRRRAQLLVPVDALPLAREAGRRRAR